jgi:hypothetical protein
MCRYMRYKHWISWSLSYVFFRAVGVHKFTTNGSTVNWKTMRSINNELTVYNENMIRGWLNMHVQWSAQSKPPILKVLWHVHSKPGLWSQKWWPLLANGSVNMFPWQPNHLTSAVDTHTTIEKLLEAVFSMWSLQRLCKESQLEL